METYAMKKFIHTLFILNFSLDILDGVAGLDLEGDGLASQSFHKDLHSATVTDTNRETSLI